jgi:hypothetical protein
VVHTGMRIKSPEVILTVTEDHFARAVPGDPCHCTIGEATKDALDKLIPALELKDVDASTISVHPADKDGEPVVSVGFLATDNTGTEVSIRFLLEQTAAFKVAYVTDNRAAAGMRRAARKNPYALRTSEFKIRKRDARTRPDTMTNVTVTPERHIAGLASNIAQRAGSAAEASVRTVEKLESKSKEGVLPYKLTPALKKQARAAAALSFDHRGSKPRAAKNIKVYKNKRFYGD